MILTVFWAILPLVASFLFCTAPIPDTNIHSSEKGSGNRGKGIVLCVLCIFLGSAAENVMTNWISGYMENALQLPKSVGDILGLAVFALLLALCRVLTQNIPPIFPKHCWSA